MILNMKWTNQELSLSTTVKPELKTPVARRTLGKDVMKLIDRMDSKLDSFWERHLPQSEIAKKRRHNAGRIALTTVLVGAAAFGYNEVKEAGEHQPTFSTDTIQFVAENGDGVWDAAQQVEGHEAVDMTVIVNHIESIPENKEALSDGLQAREGIDIPVSVKP